MPIAGQTMRRIYSYLKKRRRVGIGVRFGYAQNVEVKLLPILTGIKNSFHAGASHSLDILKLNYIIVKTSNQEKDLLNKFLSFSFFLF
jgi:hypothetical protein